MHRYINATVNMTETVRVEGLVNDILSPKTLDDKIIVTNDFSFFKDFTFCPTDSENCKDQLDSLADFGMIVNGGYWIIPAGIKFSITFDGYYGSRSHEKYLLSRNGVSVVEDYGISDYCDLNVTLTPFGYKCYLASLDLNRPFIKVVEDMLVYAQYFDLL